MKRSLGYVHLGLNNFRPRAPRTGEKQDKVTRLVRQLAQLRRPQHSAVVPPSSKIQVLNSMVLPKSTLGLGAAVTLLASSISTSDAFVSNAPRRLPSSASVHYQHGIRSSLSSLCVLSSDQALHTAERIAGMSRGEIQHIFDDVDSDGNGTVDIAELDLLAKYFPGESFTPELRKRLMSEIDTDGNGVIE